MVVTVQLEAYLEERVHRRAADSGVTVSDVIRAAIEAYLPEDTAPRASAYELGKDLFGRYGNDADTPTDLSVNRKREYAACLDAKQQRRSRSA